MRKKSWWNNINFTRGIIEIGTIGIVFNSKCHQLQTIEQREIKRRYLIKWLFARRGREASRGGRWRPRVALLLSPAFRESHTNREMLVVTAAVWVSSRSRVSQTKGVALRINTNCPYSSAVYARRASRETDSTRAKFCVYALCNFIHM